MSAHLRRGEIQRLLREPDNLARVVKALYPEAVHDQASNGYVVAEDPFGVASSCIIHGTGDWVGYLQPLGSSGVPVARDIIDVACAVRDCAPSEALNYVGAILRPSLHVETAGEPADTPRCAKGGGKTTRRLRTLNQETEQRLRRALASSPAAQEYLRGHRLDATTIEHFRIGVLFASGHSGETKEPLLAAPVLSRDGSPQSRLVRTQISACPQESICQDAGFTSTTSAPGGPYSTWDENARQKDVLFVSQRVTDQWRLWQAIRGTSLALRMAIVASTDESQVPNEWQNEEFWQPWHRVILGHDNDAAGESVAQRLRSLARRDVARLHLPRGMGVNCADFFDAGGTSSAFEELIDSAPIYDRPYQLLEGPKPLDELDDGDYEDGRININGAFTGGYMYYPYQARQVLSNVEHNEEIPRKTRGSQYITRIVRSDGVILGYSEDPAPRGTPRENRVLTLDDGTEIMSVPNPNMFCTWKLRNILSYCNDVKNGLRPHRPLPELLSALESYLSTVVWLPNRCDYSILATYVALSYCYNAFDAIPMLLITGEAGSGKSTTARALAAISFNGHVMGAGSEAAIIRFADQGRGLLVLDDLERAGRPSKNENGLGGINEILKVSYDKATAVKAVFENSRIRKLEFFGPKVITNITGIDPINATRIFKIHCQKMPASISRSGQIRGADGGVSEPLRQELHAWGMAQIATIHQRYLEMFSSRSDRSAQIAAPLVTIAEVSGDADFKFRLLNALKRQTRFASANLSAEEILREAVDSIVARGARRQASLPQIMNELALLPEARMTDPIHLVPEELVALRYRTRLGRMLRDIGAICREQGKVNLCREKTRTYRLDPGFVAAALERLQTSGRVVEPEYVSHNPLRLGVAFCDEIVCGSCPYEHVCAAVSGLRKGKRGRMR